MVPSAVLGRWMARMAKVVGLSRDEDKNEEFALLSCGLMLGRNLYLHNKRQARGRKVHSGICGTVQSWSEQALSAIPLHMPRTDRQGILLLAYRNSLERDRHCQVDGC